MSLTLYLSTSQFNFSCSSQEGIRETGGNQSSLSFQLQNVPLDHSFITVGIFSFTFKLYSLMLLLLSDALTLLSFFNYFNWLAEYAKTQVLLLSGEGQWTKGPYLAGFSKQFRLNPATPWDKSWFAPRTKSLEANSAMLVIHCSVVRNAVTSSVGKTNNPYINPWQNLGGQTPRVKP